MSCDNNETNNDVVSTIDPYSYIAMMEQELENTKSFSMKLKGEHLKPMIRTLLGIRDKVQYDNLISIAKKELGIQKMTTFAQNVLSPYLLANNNDNIPENIQQTIEKVVSTTSTIRNQNAVDTHFGRIAYGKQYKGKLLNMIQQVGTPDLVSLYQNASQQCTDLEATLQVISSTVTKNNDIDPICIEAAKNCLKYFSSKEDSNTTTTTVVQAESKQNGIDCEQACVQWLQNTYHEKTTNEETEVLVLQNVNVAPTSAFARSKHIARTTSNTDTGIFATTIDRNKACSEFDAVVLNVLSDGIQILEIWEAKYTLSPNTIQNAIAKKLPSISKLLEDSDSVFYYNGTEYPLVKTEKFKFGMFGLEWSSPTKALGQLKSSIVPLTLQSSVTSILKSIENNYALEIDSQEVLSNLQVLKQQLDTANSTCQFVINLGSN